MASRGRSTRRGARERARDALEDSLRQLEKQLPKNLSRMVRQLRANLSTLQTQIERLRSDGDARWARLQTQVRRDAARLFRRLEKAVEPKAAAPRARGSKPAKKRAQSSSRAGGSSARKVEPLRASSISRSAPLAAAPRREPGGVPPIGEPPTAI
jgi:peptidoglycan hydrolase CwlO-like protein